MPSFEILSSEGLPIRGDVDSPENPRALVVIVHGFKGFKDWGFFPWLSEHFCNNGVAACRFNMSRSGIGDDPESFDRLDLFADDTYSVQVADATAVTRHMQARFGDIPTFLLGHSRGGGVALVASSQLTLSGVVTWSAIAHGDRWDGETKRKWREAGSLDVVNARTKQNMPMSTRILDDYEANAAQLDILAATERLAVPLLVVHGGRDDSVRVDEALQIASRANDVSLMLIDRAGHTMNAIHPLIHVPVELAYAAQVSVRFIEAYSR
jgi:pimeloyl-ACP methyl ester carboxylesterase